MPEGTFQHDRPGRHAGPNVGSDAGPHIDTNVGTAGRPHSVNPMPRLRAAIAQCRTRVKRGRIERIAGTMIEARIAGVRVGELCRLRDPLGVMLEAEAVGVSEGRAFLTPIGDVAGLSSLAEVEPCDRRLGVPVSEALLGRVLDGLGRVLDRPNDPPRPIATIPIRSEERRVGKECVP